MLNSVKRILSVALVIVMVFTLCGCLAKKNDNTATTEGSSSGDSEAVDGGLTGTITVGYTADFADLYDLLIAGFREKYPGVTVVPQEIPGKMLGQINQMIALAGSDKMPDVCVGSEYFGTILQEGWAYPLNNLIEEDADKEYIMDQALINFSYGGQIYALPYQIQFHSIAVNMDLLEELNMDAPDYDWTISEFVELAKKATTTTTSGINYIYNAAHPTWGLDTKLMSAMVPEGYHQYGYSFDTHAIDLTAGDAWVKANELIQELKSVYALVSDDLKYTGGEVSEYERRFGEGADALLSGRVLFGNHSSWETRVLENASYDYDFYPVPTQDGLPEKIQTHFDFAYMTTKVTEENRDAAYAFLKFITYSEEGNMIKLAERKAAYEDDPKTWDSFIPASCYPAVMEEFQNNFPVSDGIKYMYKTIIERPETIHIADCDKLIPNYWSDIVQFRDAATEQVQAGQAPTSLVVDFQSKAAAAMEATWTYFSSCMDKNIEEFYNTHPWETNPVSK
ncbi:MAG: carbohydrate ABC transporter substrate-binding protein [Oscillospiraceae bacterium]|nr:carbohydrate ABC transporter substrate-binding protein [Oscillospiraceae bacterium]